MDERRRLTEALEARMRAGQVFRALEVVTAALAPSSVEAARVGSALVREVCTPALLERFGYVALERAGGTEYRPADAPVRPPRPRNRASRLQPPPPGPLPAWAPLGANLGPSPSPGEGELTRIARVEWDGPWLEVRWVERVLPGAAELARFGYRRPAAERLGQLLLEGRPVRVREWLKLSVDARSASLIRGAVPGVTDLVAERPDGLFNCTDLLTSLRGRTDHDLYPLDDAEPSLVGLGLPVEPPPSYEDRAGASDGWAPDDAWNAVLNVDLARREAVSLVVHALIRS